MISTTFVGICLPMFSSPTLLMVSSSQPMQKRTPSIHEDSDATAVGSVDSESDPSGICP